MKDDLSLFKIMKDNPDIALRIRSVKEKVKQDKLKIDSMVEQYNSKYEKEIQDGTAKKHILITEGEKKGLTKEEVERSSGFIPSVYTPNLNWLYFFMQEAYDPKLEIKRQQLDEAYNALKHDEPEFIEIDGLEKTTDMYVFMSGKITQDKFNTLKKLKRMSRSSNENEAFIAYRQCLKMCREYDIEFDKIPE